MTRTKRALALLLPAAAALTTGLGLARSSPAGSALKKSRVAGKPFSASDRRKASPLQKIGQMPLYFIENRGRLDPRVAFYVQGHDKTLFFTKKGITFALSETKHRGGVGPALLKKASFPQAMEAHEDSVERWVVKLDFLGANPSPKITAGDRLAAVVSYFEGPREKWKTGLPTYGSIGYSDLWPGIDLIYSGTANRLKYSFLVKPGADPARVRLAYRGASGLRLTKAGQLEVETPAGALRDDTPYAYQEVEGRRVGIRVAYSLDRASAGGPHRYGFAIDSYDRGKPLVLDPAVFVYAGYIGGSGSSEGDGIAVDSFGNAYVTGSTYTDPTFPVAVGPDLTSNGGWDAFVAKVNSAGTALIYCGYIGGSSDDFGGGIAVDSFGNAYVTGRTTSTEATFPVTVGPDLISNGGWDAFVAKVNSAGTALIYCGYIGGSGDDGASGIAVDSFGNAYVTGSTTSTEATFPVTVGPDLTYNGGTSFGDGFVAKVNAVGSSLVYCGYIGGSGDDGGSGVAVDSSGNAYVTGSTTSTETTFPVTVGPDLTFNGGSFNGGDDAFVAKVNSAGTALIYCGYIGGGLDESGYGIAVDSFGNAYVTGFTTSSESTFPVIVGPNLTNNGGADAFVAKVNAAGTALVYCGFIGGNSDDSGYGIAVDRFGNAYVAGFTDSTEATFPVTGGPGLTYNGDGDAFVAKVNAAGTGLVYCGYIGGAKHDVGGGIAVDSFGNAHVTGFTFSTEATFPVTVGPDLTFNGTSSNAFVTKVAVSRSFYTLSPCRILDTRDPDGPWGGPALSAGAVRTFMIVGRCSVPATANAVSINATVTQPTALGHLVLFAGGSPQPPVSTVNFRAGQTRANNAIVRLGTPGTLSVACGQATGTTHFILDVNGYLE